MTETKLKIDADEIAFLREVAGQGAFARSENLPQRSYPNIKAKARCRAKGLVIYFAKERNSRRGYWYLSASGRDALASRPSQGRQEGRS